MRQVLAFISLLILAGSAYAMTDTQAAYLEGFNDGWEICYLRLTNATAYNETIQAYNDELNASLNATEAAALWLAPAYPIAYELPEVFR
jgi:hypothetical protein